MPVYCISSVAIIKQDILPEPVDGCSPRVACVHVYFGLRFTQVSRAVHDHRISAPGIEERAVFRYEKLVHRIEHPIGKPAQLM